MGWLLDQFDDARFEINDVTEHEDLLVFRHTNRGRGKVSGAETHWDVWRRDVPRRQGGSRSRFTTQEEALEAAGLSE